ncbi:hypothetical protein [Aquimarina rubra]|uniref:Uncharacterized protein n=1 Tax=Aquimarina rubra TaxID=1920033 RepID=A0ABW5L9Z7_9FLAO
MKKNNLHNNKEGFKVPDNYFDTFEKRLFEKISQEDQEDSIVSNKISSGLKEPDSYFDTFENQLMQKLNIDKNDSSTLADNLKTGLTTPDNYFENVENTILQKTIGANPDTKVVSLFTRKNILYVSGIAAMIAMIISVSINSNRADSFSFDTLALTDIQEYFEEGNAEISDAEIAELLDDNISFVNTINEDEISDEELENYLSDEELADEIIYVE